MAVNIYEALTLIDKELLTLSTELIPIENAIKRISAKTLKATIALPTFNNSAMDGYGLKGEANHYTIIGKILAGDSHTYEVKDEECIKILTGAQVPSSVETIIPQENTKESDTSITIEKSVPFGANIRYRGEDINEGEDILIKGDVINSSHIGLLASQGITHVEVFRKVSVGIFASGSELKLHHEKLGDSQVYNSNTPYLLSRSEELGCETRFVGKSDDDIESLKNLISSALDCDIIITSGGVSVGEADYTKEAFSDLGMDTIFNKVQVKPGKPTTFGKIGNTLVLNLPGNPLASALNFEIFGKFIILKLSGQKSCYPNSIKAKLAIDISSNRPVSNIIPGTFDGEFFKPLAKYAPGNVNVLNHCNGMIIIDEKTDKLKKDDNVKFIPIRWNFLGDSFNEFTS
jgi:molybdopterin molybdotransferase